jgi:hypothetical protein
VLSGGGVTRGRIRRGVDARQRRQVYAVCATLTAAQTSLRSLRKLDRAAARDGPKCQGQGS